MNAPGTSAADVLGFWFGDVPLGEATWKTQGRMWFGKDDALDARVRERFGALHARVHAGEHADWAATPRGRLALILVCDQFPRNMFRGTPAAFASDARALALAEQGIARGDDRAMHPVERVFAYLPLEHSEHPEIQDRCVGLYEALARECAGGPLAQKMEETLDYARRHQAIIARFGRFPHRNAILGRESTPAEIEFLKQPGSSF